MHICFKWQFLCYANVALHVINAQCDKAASYQYKVLKGIRSLFGCFSVTAYVQSDTALECLFLAEITKGLKVVVQEVLS